MLRKTLGLAAAVVSVLAVLLIWREDIGAWLAWADPMASLGRVHAGGRVRLRGTVTYSGSEALYLQVARQHRHTGGKPMRTARLPL